MLSSPFFGVNVRNTLCVTADREQPRHPRPAAIGDLDPDQALPDRHRLPGKTRAAMPQTVAEKLASSTAASPGRARRARRNGRPAPAPPAPQASRSPGPPPQSSGRRPFPGRPPREHRTGTGAHTGNAGSTQRRMSRRNAPGGPCPWPSVEADGPPHRSSQPDAVRYMSVDPATRRSTAIQGDTERDKAKRPA